MKVLLYIRGNDDKGKASHRDIGKQLESLSDGQYVIEIKKKKHIRSLDQNRYYFAILKLAAIHTAEYDIDRLHEVCKKKFNGELIHFPKSPIERIGMSTANLDTAEFSGYVSRVKMWLRDEFGLTIPEKQDVNYQVWADIETNYEKIFRD